MFLNDKKDAKKENCMQLKFEVGRNVWKLCFLTLLLGIFATAFFCSASAEETGSPHTEESAQPVHTLEQIVVTTKAQ
jgi:hypothetical protein